MQTQPAEQPPKEQFFDETGQDIPPAAAEPPEPDPAAEAARAAAEPPAPATKFRIGDREFASADEAIAYANSTQTAIDAEKQLADAYRQGLVDAAAAVPTVQPGVTQPAAAPKPGLNTEELYTNPDEFLKKYAQQIKQEALSEVTQREAQRAQDDQIWREFEGRHPALADFRGDVEDFVARNNTEVRAVIASKGRPAAYDYIATKLRADWERRAAALKPQRELPNATVRTAPATSAATVTPPETPKKASSMSEQIRSIRKGRR